MATIKLRSNPRWRLSIAFAMWGLMICLPVAGFAAQGDCSQPVSNGTVPVATDCLFILNVAVGLQTCSPECICAPSGTLPARATDALLCLGASVGTPVMLDCPCEPVSSEGDDFNDNDRNNALWGTATDYGNGRLNETSQHLEYTCSSGTSDDGEDWEWIGNVLPIASDWAVQIDLVNETVPSADNQVNSFGFGVYNPADWGDEVYAEMYASSLGGPPARNGFYAEMYADDAYIGAADSFAQETTIGAVRMLYDSTSKVLSTQYDTDPSDGYQWIPYGTFGIAGTGGTDGNANWGLAGSDVLQVYVYGFSARMKIDAGKMWGDNFLVTGGVAFP
jgi:hypothetical protein